MQQITHFISITETNDTRVIKMCYYYYTVSGLQCSVSSALASGGIAIQEDGAVWAGHIPLLAKNTSLLTCPTCQQWRLDHGKLRGIARGNNINIKTQYLLLKLQKRCI